MAVVCAYRNSDFICAVLHNFLVDVWPLEVFKLFSDCYFHLDGNQSGLYQKYGDVTLSGKLYTAVRTKIAYRTFVGHRPQSEETRAMETLEKRSFPVEISNSKELVVEMSAILYLVCQESFLLIRAYSDYLKTKYEDFISRGAYKKQTLTKIKFEGLVKELWALSSPDRDMDSYFPHETWAFCLRNSDSSDANEVDLKGFLSISRATKVLRRGIVLPSQTDLFAEINAA
eukprot:TRINITY_DN8290_c0_g1_i5.p1 TRINITY_DN8290_c0_g1~~TRINITY_DN8290_c0_g1_i5.p1  ORF type:complete len:229 (+),score=47.56 TRINITY_DN8290_c0_g1_i5:86-772(+)